MTSIINHTHNSHKTKQGTFKQFSFNGGPASPAVAQH